MAVKDLAMAIKYGNEGVEDKTGTRFLKFQVEDIQEFPNKVL